MKDLIDRAEKIAAQAGNSLGSDCIRDLIKAINVSQANVDRLSQDIQRLVLTVTRLTRELELCEERI